EMFCYQSETACLVSVIIPVCNAARYLNECLKSVSAQTLQDIEIICVDDDSRDGSFTLLKRRASHEVRLKVLKNAQHMGTSYTKNKGLAAAHGEYVYFLRATDWIEPEELKRLYDFATAHPMDIAGAGIRPYYTYTKSKIPLSSMFFKEMKNYLQSEDERPLPVTADNFKEVLRLSSCLENRLYRRDFLRRHNLWFGSGHEPYEDECFWIKLMSCFPVMSFMKQAGYFYRIYKENVGEQTKRPQKSARQVLKHSIRAAAEYMRLHQKEVLLPMLFDRYDFCFGSSIHIGKVLTVDWHPKHKVLKIAAVTVFSKHRLPEQQTYEIKILGIRIDLWHKYIKRLCCRINGADV
ncbi:MAG: glycosyltransferase family 2 protein, partial [Alphaproteobacteria bacterium]